MTGQLKGLRKIINSDIVKKIYPMVDNIEVHVVDYRDGFYSGPELEFLIHLNDSEIDEKNMYEKGFDPHYLVDKIIQGLLKYIDIKPQTMSFMVYGPEGDVITYWNDR